MRSTLFAIKTGQGENFWINMASNQLAISKALKRLCERGLIDIATPEVYNSGKSNLYRARRRPGRRAKAA
jgi:hypothetical protein